MVFWIIFKNIIIVIIVHYLYIKVNYPIISMNLQLIRNYMITKRFLL
jgi:hypothetical protein